MNKVFVAVGGILLILGVVVVAVGAVGVLRGLTVVSTFTQPQTGEFVSSELVLNTTSGVAVTSAAANGGLVPSQDLSLVNSTNIAQYAVTPHSTVGGTATYIDLSGNYYYVAFASSQPSSKIVATPQSGGTLASSPLILGGLVAAVVGIVVMVVGARKKSR